jgi:hypothetical protein
MSTEIVVAIIGCVSTISAAAIGAVASIKKDMAQKHGAGFSARRYPKEFTLLTVGLFLGLVVLLAGYAIGQNANKSKAELERKAQIGKEVRSYSDLVSQGIDAKKPYIIPSAVLIVNLERTADGKSIVSDRHMIYQLQGLTDISKEPGKNGDAFVEEYHSRYNVDQVAGADPESVQEDRPSMKRWNVWFDLPAGERHALVTGAHVVMPFTLPSPHSEHMFTGLKANEDAFCYPNTEGDVIEELVIVVQSGTLDLYLPGSGDDDAVFQRGQSRQSMHADLFESKASTHRHQSLVARFRNVQKNDIVGLRVGWKTGK